MNAEVYQTATSITGAIKRGDVSFKYSSASRSSCPLQSEVSTPRITGQSLAG